MPNALIATDCNALLLVGEIDAAVLDCLWPGAECATNRVFLNPRRVRNHIQTRDDYMLRLSMFNCLAPYVPDVLSAPHTCARYEKVRTGELGVTLASPLRGWDEWGDYLVVCVKLMTGPWNPTVHNYVVTLYPWFSGKRLAYLRKNAHVVRDTYNVLTPDGPILEQVT
jgi:hypothetical protein